MAKFRKNAMDARDKADILDNALQVVTPTGWLVLLTLVALLLTLVIWAVFGNVSSSVSGSGILINSGQVMSISALAEGTVVSIETYEGKKVQMGEILGRIWQTQLENKYTRLDNEISAFMDEKEYRDKTNQIAAVAQELRSTSLLVSPVDGTVLEVNKSIGENIKRGESFAVVQVGGKSTQLMALAFFVGGDGKKVEEGSEVRIALDSIRSDEYGFLIGKVKSVSMYPTSSNTIAGWLGNTEYAKKIIEEGKGLVYMAQIQVMPDEKTKSGYLWTSQQGPPKAIQPGTTFSVSCLIKKQPPIVLAFNWLKTLLEGS